MGELLQKWQEELKDAVYMFDIDTFKAFYRKWSNLGVYVAPLPPDKVLEITLRKMVLDMKGADPEKLKEAKEWLKERGFSC